MAKLKIKDNLKHQLPRQNRDGVPSSFSLSRAVACCRRTCQERGEFGANNFEFNIFLFVWLI
jgi:hypothetical protein